MHVSGIPLDLHWFLQLIFTSFIVLFGLLHLVKNTASRYFVVDGNFEQEGSEAADEMLAVSGNGDACAVCRNSGKKICSGCKRVRYCSQTCQRKHWQTGHKTKCEEFKLFGHKTKCEEFKLFGDLNSKPSVTTDPGRRASSCRGKYSTAVSLVSGGGTCNILQQPKKVLFPYDEFVNFFNWDKPGFPPCGLLNCGNSCFANVVLQCLGSTRPLMAFLLERGHRRECRRNDWCFLCELQNHVERASQSLHPFPPINILSRLPNIGGNLGYGKQEDAHEFMSKIDFTFNGPVGPIDEASVGESYPFSLVVGHPITKFILFQVICSKCNKISNRYENMMDLTVEIQGDAASLEDCLEQFTVKEWLHGENMYKCDGCDDYVKAWKRLTIHRAPNILTIALKRFQSGRFGKLNKRVTFPETLDLGPYMCEEGDGADLYRLYAVVVHVDMLNASFFGHYICFTKDFGGNWYRIDDCKVVFPSL
ncbi:hypothetical protein HHK36_013710 [Tetracentron sinense]|uniref:Ubiquitinyl hydrolase 1 n=1 Tax=Tetracentron sinense TaxID=13715 RepID=A0A835DGZ7_TETSI|nr:hypothetical protein HHK36_013710 [Tetracentron sinense]